MRRCFVPTLLLLVLALSLAACGGGGDEGSSSSANGDCETVDAPPDHALDVFYHPFAHCDGAVEGLLAVA